jgi:hypothetical protein
MFEIYPFRYVFYFLPGQDLEACVTHYHEEKSFRAQRNDPLQLIGAYDRMHQSLLVLIDTENWKTESMTVVDFGP